MTTERPDDLITLMEGEFQQIIGRVIIQDQKTSGTNGGTFTSGAWRTRDLNTTVLNTVGAGYSLSSNQFTIPTGSYIILASAPAYDVDRHQIRLQNITDSSTELSGSSEFTSSGNAVQTRSFIVGFFAITASKVFELQHRCQTSSVSANSFGWASGTSFTVQYEIYTIVNLWKIV